ncbi:cytochrome-c peroxidase [Sulfurimonas lithotrophica]|uniref:Cytochrome-c peroxidase n=1 Tax=Sulfurimonas lithotrophica TaxID=2590022 RepID=A0A5P8P0B7_9BACT|nr:cytochrome-c peroxidase [Sulfurimonas lithotrophica]QFR49153.1 cytochrome-c peroxidase [Sulfurimonas lithotrophica]
MNLRLLIIFALQLYLYSQPIMPLPLSISVDEKKAQLGKELFFDTILSLDNSVSCATCHDIEKGGDDGLVFSIGINGRQGDINAPTVFNSIYNFRQFWNGRAKDLKEQAKGPIENPLEMGNNFGNLIEVLSNTPYRKRFNALYKDGITADNIADAIAEYEKTLITPESAFDKYLNGDEDAITKEQKEGYEVFKDVGCITCHHGINIGGNLYNKFGVIESATSKRKGRYEVTQNKEDIYYFKVPSLRNIEKTAPYLHDGRYDKLEDVVKFMSKYQLGRAITDTEIDKIVKFLHSLSGKIPQGIE